MWDTPTTPGYFYRSAVTRSLITFDQPSGRMVTP